MKRLAIFFVLSLLIVAGSTSSVLAQETTQETETFIILYDESHYQYFNSEMMTTALSSLNDSLDTPALNVNIELIVQNDSFNSTNLQGVDLVMITNPGTDEDGELPDILGTERTALQNLLGNGGSVFYMSNPLSYNQNVTGHADPLNDLLVQNFGADVEASVSGDTDNTTVIVDNYNYVNNQTFIKINSKNFNDQTLVTELNNVTVKSESSFLYYGAEIRESNPGDITANASDTSYVINNDFEIDLFQNGPKWLYANEIGSSGGRALLTGSTIMFSDYAFDTTSTWIEQFNNLELFQNLVAWLLELTPFPEDQSIVNEPFNPFFIRTNVFYAIIFGLSLFVGTAAYFIYRGRLQPSKILDIFTKKSSSDSSSGSSSGKSSSGTSQRKSRSKRRKRT